ncbi:MAG: nicotinate-nucleotide adenylyltransferase [Eubacterium sp.]|nr:nicotinate-nucleotide adenylyltransferase [Eubacterium sp.]
MKKIGLMGGTFNPIHNINLIIGQIACEKFKLDQVWFMPCKQPPHKTEGDLVSEEDRKRMVQLAIDPYKHFSCSDFEFHLPGKSYTSRTLEALTETCSDCQFYFIMGGDSLRDFDKWHKPEKIAKLCHILACGRQGEDLKKLCQKWKDKYGARIDYFTIPESQISSSQIRKDLGDGLLPIGQVDDRVLTYIRMHGLYGTKPLVFDNDHATKKLYQMLSSSLRPKRYIHTLGVATTAASLAMAHGHSVQEAELSGLLHDCAKYLTNQEQINECIRLGVDLTSFEMENPALIHGKLGAVYARDRYGVDNPAILSAISYHTTGKANMTRLEKIVYIADYIEPNRTMETYPHSLVEVRAASFMDLDQAMIMILENTFDYLQKNNRPIDPLSRECYEFYKTRR